MNPVEAIVSVARAVEAVFVFLQTPEGQEFLRQAREDRKEFEQNLAKLGRWFESLVKQ